MYVFYMHPYILVSKIIVWLSVKDCDCTPSIYSVHYQNLTSFGFPFKEKNKKKY